MADRRPEAAYVWRGMRLQNFRLFRDTEWLDFRPITLLFGKNSSGKTTLLRAPLLFSQLLTTQSMLGDIPLAGPYVDFGSYPDLVTDAEYKRDVCMDAKLDLSQYFGRYVFRGDEDQRFREFTHPTIGFTLHWNHPQSRSQLNEFRISAAGRMQLRAERKGPDSIRVEIPSLDVHRTVQKVPELSARFLQFLPSLFLRSNARVRSDLDYVFLELADALTVGARSLVHVGPLRDMPKRSYLAESAGAVGGQTQTAVAIMASRTQILKAASDALDQLGLARSVAVEHPAPGYVGITVTHPETGRRDNLADVGFGTSQVLPIVVQILNARPGNQVLIEQPELHLHPETQGALADVLVGLAQAQRVGLVIESHSEHIFLRIRRRVAEGALPAGDVAIYVVDRGQVRSAGIDENGDVDMGVFPKDFFEEEWIEAVELARARISR